MYSLFEQDHDRAERYINEGLEKGWRIPLFLKGVVGNMYLKTGRVKKGTAMMEECIARFLEIIEKHGENGTSAMLVSQTYAMLGEKEKALVYLSKAVDIGLMWGWEQIIDVDHTWENLWDEPQFKALVKKLRDEKAEIKRQILEMEERGEIDLTL
jgi:hypothetical protein